MVFDGAPEDLTLEQARAIYGTEGLREALSEGVTSTSLEPLKEAARAAAVAL